MDLNEIIAGGTEQVQHIMQDSGPNWTDVWKVIIAALSLVVAGIAVWTKRRNKKKDCG